MEHFFAKSTFFPRTSLSRNCRLNAKTDQIFVVVICAVDTVGCNPFGDHVLAEDHFIDDRLELRMIGDGGAGRLCGDNHAMLVINCTMVLVSKLPSLAVTGDDVGIRIGGRFHSIIHIRMRTFGFFLHPVPVFMRRQIGMKLTFFLFQNNGIFRCIRLDRAAVNVDQLAADQSVPDTHANCLIEQLLKKIRAEAGEILRYRAVRRQRLVDVVSQEPTEREPICALSHRLPNRADVVQEIQRYSGS